MTSITEWIVEQVATRTGVPASSIDPGLRFKSLGLGSLDVTSILSQLSAMVGRPLSPTLGWEYPTPQALGRHLSAPIRQIAKIAPRDIVDSADEPIAIVGLSCRFPRATDKESFWALLRDGVDAIGEVPKDRWDLDSLYDPDPSAPGKMATRWGGFLDEVDRFDPIFFGIAPREAAQMDPQQRLALELSWEALEDAGIVPATLLDSRTGVFLGAMWMDYARLAVGVGEQIALHTATGLDLSIIAARISYTLGAVGPSLTVNTACSSSLVAVHLACQSLLRNETTLALAGGVNLLLAPESTIAMTKFGAMAPDGRSKAFDARANGYVRGEGGGMVALKRLSRAKADGDRIYCLVRATAVNNDGFSNGLTAPSPGAQRAVLAEACARASVAAAEVQYVEAHGTGTMLGDPIEANALGAVYGAGRPAEQPLRIGSVKTNIGHLESAAGIAGLVKVALSMQRRALPKSLHFQKANPHIDFDALRVRVQTALEPWESHDGRLLAGVSSFGFGGTNGHAILEARAEDAPSLFVLSAESAESLRERAGETARALLDVNGASIEQACARAARETPESFRLATVVRSQEELAERLRAFAAGRDVPGVVCGRAKERPRVALLFTGQGAQYAGMGRGVYEREPAFRAALDRSCALFAAELERPLLAVMWPEPGSKDEGLLDRTGYTQPALFALEFALAELWRSRGVEPQLVSGHSIGEIAAACVAGILPLPDAVRLVAARGRLMEALPEGGAMVAIAADEARVKERIRSVCDRVAIAAVNSRSNVVISGDRDPVLSVADSFAAEGVKTRRLTVSHAFHSPLMAPMRDAFRDLARSLRYRKARIPIVSNVDGRRAERMLGADHWVRHVEEPVRFADGAAALKAEGCAVLLEVGPHPVLLDLASDVPGFEFTQVASLTRGGDDAATMLAALGRLFVAGVPVRLAPEETDSARLFVVSGKNEAALRAQCERLDAHLAANPGQTLRDVGYSLATARSAFEHRAAIVARTRDELRSKLRTAEGGEVRRTRGSAAFVFSGQGSQAIGMGRELHAGWPAFRDALDEVLDLLDAQLARPLREVMWAEPGTAQAQLLDQTGYTQPALFAVQHALTALWKSWGVEPALVAGHSIGEVTAACVSGVLSLEDAARLVCARGRLMQEIPEGGAMLSVAAAEGEVAKWLGDTSAVEIAAVNGPSQVVVAGLVEAIETLQKQLADAGVRTKRLAVSHAFHSAQMDAMLGAFAEVAKTVRYAPARLPLVSNVSGELAGPEISTPEYWVRHVRRPVRFADGVRASSRAGAGIYLEVGPRATLLGLLPQDALALSSLRGGSGETESMLAGLGAFWKAGGDVKWPGVLLDGGKRVDLPTYAWQRQRYWVEAPPGRLQGEPTAHPLLGVRIPAAGRAGVYETVFGLEQKPWLQDHRVFGRALVPAAALAELLRAAGEHATGQPVTLRGLLLQSPMVLTEGKDLRVQVVVGESGEVEIHSQPSKSGAGDAWRLHATAALAEGARPPGAVDLDAVRARCPEMLEPGGLYARFQQMGLDYGPRFRGLRGVRRGNGEALAEIHFDEEDWESGISAMVLDAAIQAAIAAAEDRSELALPFELRSLTVHGGAAAFAHVRRSGDATDVALLDAAGNCVAELEALRLLRAEREKLSESTADDGFYRVSWREHPIPPAAGRTGRWLLLGPTQPEVLPGERVRLDELGPALDAAETAGVACLWERRAAEAPDAAAQRICIEALQVVQVVARRSRPVRLRLITQGAVAALSGDLLQGAALAGAPLWGLGRTVMQEHPELDCRLVDVDDLASVARELLVEDGETQVAWRGGRRQVARLVPAKKEERRDPRLEGTVLVTGGLGALGLHVARYFAKQKVPHLLLLARRGMETPGAADAIAALEAQGTRVTVAAVDVANRGALAEALERIPGELPLRGVVHAAGVLDDGVIAEQDPERFARVLLPKLAGAWNLHELTAGRPLEVFAVFSSVSGLFGAAGQSNYAAANAFLDALAEHRRANGLAGQSLAWGPWSDGGMAARLGSSHKARLERQGIRPLTAADGTALFAAALGRSDAHLGAVHLDLAALGSASGESVPPFFRELVRPAKRAQASAQPPGSWVATIAALDPARREEEVRAAVSADVARVLSWTGPVPPDAPLSELGLDSLMAVEVRNQLGRRVGRTLPATVAFDHPTVSALSRYLLQDVLEIERTRKNIVAPRSSKADEPIAIVGFGCRYPGGVDGADSFWKLLSGGIDAVSTVPRERWDAAALYDPDPDAAGKMVTREGGFLREIDRFDAAFFGISPREAAAMDPQQRILLETSWEALEHAGLAPAKLSGTEAGVFVGLMYQEYASLGPGLSALEGYGVTGSLGSVASGRLSYLLGLKGPSLTVDTACSSSLVTLHLACESLRRGECSLALAGGVTLMLTPSIFVEFSRLRGLAPDGRCKSFSAAADGVGWSEGCGMLVLKKLSDAQRDGDRVLALVRGTAVNQDGRSSGLTAPNGPSQETVIERALQQAGVAPGKVSYVECHGTGTRLGDPIEVQALGNVLGPGRERPLVIGSVKSNLGHSQAAAGVAGIIKVVLSLQHEKIPKSLHFGQPSPHIAWGEVPVEVASEAIGWPRGPAPRIAGVSSFGISGTNAHAILQEPPEGAAEPASAVDGGAELFVVSAKTEAALAAQCERLAAHVRAHPEQVPGDVAFSLATARSEMEERLAVVARSTEELPSALLGDRARGRRAAAAPGRVAFVFSGQGSQRPGMGRELHSRWRPFREAFDQVVSLFDGELERPLAQVMWAEAGTAEAALLDQTGYTQPALFAMQYALCGQLRSWGVEPHLVAGHSIGEIAAACVAGVLRLEDAAKLVAARARLMQGLPAGGTMASVNASEADVRRSLAEAGARQVDVAAINGPAQVVIAGPRPDVVALCERWRARGTKTKELVVSHAFHSPQMDAMLEPFREAAAQMTYHPPKLPLVGNVTGKLAGAEVATADYWVRHVREPVRFADGARALQQAGATIFVEVGPRPTLLGLLPQCLERSDPEATLVASLRPPRDEAASLLEALGDYWTAGGEVVWASVFGEQSRRVELPTYAWQRQSYWLEAATEKAAAGEDTGDALLGRRLAAAGCLGMYQTRLSLSSHAWLGDHRVAGHVVVPGAAIAEMIGAAAANALARPVAVHGLVLQAPLLLEEDDGVRVQIVVSPRNEVSVYSQPATSKTRDAWRLHATAAAAAQEYVTGTIDLVAVRSRCGEEVEASGLYERFARTGLEYGSGFRGLERVWRGGAEALAKLAGPSGVSPMRLDAALQAFRSLDDSDELRLPFEVDSLRLDGAGATAQWAYARRNGDGGGEILLLEAGGRVVAEARGLRLRSVDRSLFSREAPAQALYRLEWRERPIAAAQADPGRWVLVAQDGSSWAAALVESGLDAVRATPRTVAEALAGVERPAGVLCLWEAREGESPDATAGRVANEGLEVLQVLARVRAPVRLRWATRGAVALDETGALQADSLGVSSILGLARTAIQEHPELGCRLVDAADAADLLRELTADDDETEVAWRQGRRYAARLVRAAAAESRSDLALDGTVVVTGGLGALGLHVARWFATRGALHLLLTGRRGLRTPGAAEAVAELERATRVTVAEVDVADRAAMAAVLASIPAELPLVGVVHAAGVLDDGVLVDQRPERFAKVFSPKVQGAWNLHELTEAQPLQFFVLFSSISGLLGAAGQGNYAAANTFLDALAAHRRGKGLAGQSLAWGAWADGGMAASLDKAHRERLERRGMGAWSAAEGAALFGEVLHRRDAHLGLIRLDLDAARRSFGGSVPPVFGELIQPAKPPAARAAGSWPLRLAALDPPQREAEVRAAVGADVARVMSWQGPLPVDRPLSALGLDSLTAVELRNELGRRVGATLPATLAFDHPTVEALSRWLLTEVLHLAERPTPKTPSTPAAVEEPIAIVGFGCRYPGGVKDGDTYWKLLEEGIDAVGRVPRTRWDAEALYDPDPDARGKIIAKEGGFLDRIDEFDAAFFGVSPREAVALDPQQRLLLETSWEALEHAGWNPERLAGSDTGVFVGLMYQEYAGLSAPQADLDGYVLTGSLASVASGRVSYVLGLKGPTLTVDTACSSSLVTLHLACQALRRGECSSALAGGVTLMLTPAPFLEFSRLRGLSPDGRCKSFSASADGVGWSEGCGMLALKRLSDARRDGDRILGLIRGTAVNHDGRSNGLTAPNGASQELVIERALREGAVSPLDVSYVECHGTGTKLGDPIEVNALGKVLGPGRERPLLIGSVKSNLGHTQAAAGVAGVIKVLLALEREKIPRSLHFTEPSPHIAWSELPVQVAGQAMPWPRGDRPRIAGVSSFGISGTNAHVVLQESPERAEQTAREEQGAQLFVVSAKNEAALAAQCARLEAYLETHPEEIPADIALSLSTTRSAMDERLAMVATTTDDLRALLLEASQGRTPAGVSRGTGPAGDLPKVVFVFPGQGSQWLGMGRRLLASEPAFRAAFAECDRAIQAEAGWSPLAEIAAEGGASRLDRVDVVQPILFAFGVALAALWRSWGVEADAVVGHSMGEVAAAHVAGALSLEDAVAVICRRSALLRRISGQGEMAVVDLSSTEAESAIAGYEDRLGVAACNSPRSTVLSGEPAALGEVLRTLESKGVFCRRVRVDVASHSPQVDSLRDDLLAVLAGLQPAAARIPIRSTVLGKTIEGTELTATYWWDNLRNPVRFAGSVQALMAESHGVFIEMSPHPILLTSLEEIRLGTACKGIAVGSVRREEDERATLLEALGALWVRGHRVAWDRVLPADARRVPLPTYAWQRESYWPKPDRAAKTHGPGHPLLGESHSLSTSPGVRWFETSLDLERLPWLGDHRLHRALVFPGAGYLEMALASGAAMLGADGLEIADLRMTEVLDLAVDAGRSVQLVATEEKPGNMQFQISSRTAGGAWRSHATGTMRRTEQQKPAPFDLDALRARFATRPVAGDVAYGALTEVGLEYGPAFRGVQQLWRNEGEALGRVQLPKSAGAAGPYRVHPALLDACFQVALAGLLLAGDEPAPWVPIELRSIRLFEQPARELWCYAQEAGAKEPGRRTVDLLLLDADGGIVADLAGLLVQRLERPRAEDDWFLETAWQRATAPSPAAGKGRFLLLGEGGGVAAALATALENAGHRVVRATRAAIAAAFDTVGPTAVVHLGSLDVDAGLNARTVEAALENGCDDVLAAVRALVMRGWAEAPRLWLVTRGAQAAGDGEVAVAQAPLVGFGRVIALEHPELRCTRLDLDPARPEAEIGALFDELVSEDREGEIAWRGGERLVGRLRKRPPQMSRLASVDPVARADATYVVTGGLGALGLSVAGWLVERGARHLVLLGRSGAPGAQAREAVAALEARGARMTVARADVANRAQLERVLDEVEKAGPPIRGVVHAAGILDDGLLLQQTPERLRTVMAPKILGALNLHELTQGKELDFFVLYSSAAGLLGSPGQSNYAAANTFLDALAHYRRARGLAALSIDWGAFAGAGLAAREGRAERLESIGIRSLRLEDGLRALDRLWHVAESQVGVVPLDAARWIELHPAARGRLSELVEARPSADGECPQSGDLARRLAAANPQERTDLVEALVRAEVARVLRIPEKRVEADTHFVNLGMDSLRGLELRNRLGEALQLPLPAVLFFQYPTLGAVTGFVLDAFLRAQLGSDARGNGTVDAVGNAPQEEEGRF